MVDLVTEIQAAFPADLSKRINHALSQHPDLQPLFLDLAVYAGGLKTRSQHDIPSGKKRKLEEDLPITSKQANGSIPSGVEAVVFECKDVSFQVPARKKLRLQVVADKSHMNRQEIRLQNQQSNQVEYMLSNDQIEAAFCLPVPEKQQRQWNFLLFPKHGATTAHGPPCEQVVFTMNEIKPHGSIEPSNEILEHDTFVTATERQLNRLLQSQGKHVVIPSAAEFASSIEQPHRKGEKAYHVKAHRGSKDGYLFFLSNGIVFGFKKPLAYFAFPAIDAISYTSVLQRTFNLVVTVHESPDEIAKEVEFSMLDQADFAGIDEYIRRHGLNDASMAAQRRAKAYNVNKESKGGDGSGDANGGEEQSELQKAEQELQDEEDGEEEDYVASGGESEGEGEDSEEDGEGYEEDGDGAGEEEDVEGPEDDGDRGFAFLLHLTCIFPASRSVYGYSHSIFHLSTARNREDNRLNADIARHEYKANTGKRSSRQTRWLTRLKYGIKKEHGKIKARLKGYKAAKMDYNHDHFTGRSNAVLAVGIITIALSTTVVFFRIISRAAIVKKVSADDYFMVLAWMIACGLTTAMCFGCAWGLGRHQWHVPMEWQTTLRKAIYAFTILYQPALMALKTSILAFYLSFSTTHRVFRWACIATLVTVNAGGLALTLLSVFQCLPVSAVFDIAVPAGAKCTDIVTIYLSSAPLNLITDFAILFLPMPILTGMRLPKKQKIILVITFGMGIFVTAVDVVRIAYLQQASQTRLSEINAGSPNSGRPEAGRTDFSYYVSFSFMWSVVEVNIGIMCACVPGLKPLMARFMPHMLRDPHDAASIIGSISAQGGVTANMANLHRIPSMAVPTAPPEIHPRDFGSVSHDGASDDGPMGMLDFLTTPETTEFPSHLERTQTALTNTSRNTRPETPTFFDFVNMKGRKSMVHMSNKESLFPVAMVTIIFFVWGFEYGMLDILNAEFQRISHMTAGQSTAIHSAYWAGYFFGPLTVGRLVLKHWGFKACFSVGLAIFACGTLIYWPAAVLTSFPAFVITNFIVAFGLSVLEVAANPFIALCGPQQYSEIRLNLCQGIQAIGSIVAPLIATRAFVHQDFHAPSLIDTQWAYLGISLATIFLAVAFHYVPLPEASDADLEDAAERMDGANHAKLGNVKILWILLGLAAFAQFCYVGGQEVNATTFDAYFAAVIPGKNASGWLAVLHTAFAGSRFLAAGLSFFIKPRILLLSFLIGLVVFNALAITYNGNTAAAMLTMVFFMEGPIFPLIFAQGLRGMGRHTKRASVIITASCVGGAIFAPISNYIRNSQGRLMYSLVIAIAAFSGISLYALTLNGLAPARVVVDPVKDLTLSTPGSSSRERRPGSTDSRGSKALSFFSMRKKATRHSADAVEWKEQKDGEPELQDHGLL
ncbi:hypothetical protein LTR62_007327 [Meristemomyces frigidus]|uniref:Histone chaperone RTT106/FACT complex subunit SPT16-like middle domain-containing protein n=1 Tax=Meristemomyces frigidus TaxID=1508187 RepID=A0AAN7TI84_9PEZI|nr:hypothetical protein LTR62_007327 [Meristemomyces frigidus]